LAAPSWSAAQCSAVFLAVNVNGAERGWRAGAEVALDVEPLGMRSSWLSSTMALAETTVVETVSEGWPQVLSEPEMAPEADRPAGA